MSARTRALTAMALFLSAITPVTANQPPKLVLRTNPPANFSQDPPLIEGVAPLSVRFNLCNSEDQDEGDSLNWQFHFGDSGAPPFSSDGVFRPDADHECRVDHVYEEGIYTATLSVTDKHLEDQQHGVVSMARSTTKVMIRAYKGQKDEPVALTPGCGTGAPCRVFVTSTMHRGNFGATPP